MDLTLDGRWFRAAGDVAGGDVGTETTFEFHEDATGLVWARYAGGRVRLGFLVGTRTGDVVDFRYTQLTVDGDTATGHSTDRIEQRAGGRLRLHETWQWESRAGSGTSVLDEIEAPQSASNPWV